MACGAHVRSAALQRLMPARNRMVHRAQVLRLGERDPFDTFGPDTPDQHIYGGDPLPLTWGDLTLMWGSLTLDWGSAASTLLPCYVQPRVERKVSDFGRFFSSGHVPDACAQGRQSERRRPDY